MKTLSFTLMGFAMVALSACGGETSTSPDPAEVEAIMNMESTANELEENASGLLEETEAIEQELDSLLNSL